MPCSPAMPGPHLSEAPLGCLQQESVGVWVWVWCGSGVRGREHLKRRAAVKRSWAACIACRREEACSAAEHPLYDEHGPAGAKIALLIPPSRVHIRTRSCPSMGHVARHGRCRMCACMLRHLNRATHASLLHSLLHLSAPVPRLPPSSSHLAAKLHQVTTAVV